MSTCFLTKLSLSSLAVAAVNITHEAATADAMRDALNSSDLLQMAWERNGMIGVLLVFVGVMWFANNRKEACLIRKSEAKARLEAEYREKRLAQDKAHHDELIQVLNVQTVTIATGAEKCKAVRELALAALNKTRKTHGEDPR